MVGPVKRLRIATRAIAFALTPGGRRSGGVLARTMAAVAAGTFSEEELAEARTRHWASFADDHPSRKSGLFPWEVRFYSRFLRPEQRLLVVGAGSGRDVLCFVRDGCRVTAIDEAAGALEFLERRLERAELTATIRASSIVEFESPDRFDIVIFSWLAYILIPTRAMRLAALRRAAEALLPGGRILVSYKPGRGSPHLGRISRTVARLLGGLPCEDFEEFQFSGTASEPRVYHSRFYTPAEIEAEAEAAGLGVVFHHHGAPGWDDPGCIVLARS